MQPYLAAMRIDCCVDFGGVFVCTAIVVQCRRSTFLLIVDGCNRVSRRFIPWAMRVLWKVKECIWTLCSYLFMCCFLLRARRRVFSCVV